MNIIGEHIKFSNLAEKAFSSPTNSWRGNYSSHFECVDVRQCECVVMLYYKTTISQLFLYQFSYPRIRSKE